MNKYTGARWFKGLPRWIRTLVYDLTGWQVIRMTIRHRGDAGLFAYTSERIVYSWSRAKKEMQP